MPIPSTMRAVEVSKPGGPEALKPVQRPVPQPKAGEILVKVAAAGVNRPDVLQRMGLYAVPPDASDLPGLEIAGEVVSGGKVFKAGDKVCALAHGGGYAEYCVVPEGPARACSCRAARRASAAPRSRWRRPPAIACSPPPAPTRR